MDQRDLDLIVAGAVNRDLWTCGSFSENSEEVLSQSCVLASSQLDIVFESALAAKRLGTAARCESCCADFVAGQHFVGLGLEVQILWQVQQIVLPYVCSYACSPGSRPPGQTLRRLGSDVRTLRPGSSSLHP